MSTIPVQTQHEIAALLVQKGISWSDVIYVAETGSSVHGLSIGSSDRDYTAIRMEDWPELITGKEKDQALMVRTKPEGHRSEEGDLDLQVYTLRRFSQLLGSGNPSVLTALFSPNTYYSYSPIDTMEIELLLLHRMREESRTKTAGYSFMGYMAQQMSRWRGDSSKKVTRPELIEAHGYDTKYAGHVLRLANQGIEFMQTGLISLPMEDPERQFIVDVRSGKISEEAAYLEAQHLREELERRVQASKYPEKVDGDMMVRYVSDFYQLWWSNEL